MSFKILSKTNNSSLLNFLASSSFSFSFFLLLSFSFSFSSISSSFSCSCPNIFIILLSFIDFLSKSFSSFNNFTVSKSSLNLLFNSGSSFIFSNSISFICFNSEFWLSNIVLSFFSFSKYLFLCSSSISFFSFIFFSVSLFSLVFSFLSFLSSSFFICSNCFSYFSFCSTIITFIIWICFSYFATNSFIALSYSSFIFSLESIELFIIWLASFVNSCILLLYSFATLKFFFVSFNSFSKFFCFSLLFSNSFIISSLFILLLSLSFVLIFSFCNFSISCFCFTFINSINFFSLIISSSLFCISWYKLSIVFKLFSISDLIFSIPPKISFLEPTSSLKLLIILSRFFISDNNRAFSFSAFVNFSFIFLSKTFFCLVLLSIFLNIFSYLEIFSPNNSIKATFFFIISFELFISFILLEFCNFKSFISDSNFLFNFSRQNFNSAFSLDRFFNSDAITSL